MFPIFHAVPPSVINSLRNPHTIVQPQELLISQSAEMEQLSNWAGQAQAHTALAAEQAAEINRLQVSDNVWYALLGKISAHQSAPLSGQTASTLKNLCPSPDPLFPPFLQPPVLVTSLTRLHTLLRNARDSNFYQEIKSHLVFLPTVTYSGTS